MSGKKKISNADFVAATKAVNKNVDAIADNVGEFVDIMGVVFISGETLDILKPFDMISNGAYPGKISDDVLSAFFKSWSRLIEVFENEEAHLDLALAFWGMCGMIGNGWRCNSFEFSQGAFIGVYGVFRIMLTKCILAVRARICGGESYAEKLESLKRAVLKSQQTAELARIESRAAKGEMGVDDYLELQRLKFEELFRKNTKKDLCGKLKYPKVRGNNGLLCEIWKEDFIYNIHVPKNAGLSKHDWECHRVKKGEKISPIPQRWVRQVLNQKKR